MQKKSKLTLKTQPMPDGSGDVFIEIPQEILDRLGWNLGDTIEIEKQENGFDLSKKKE